MILCQDTMLSIINKHYKERIRSSHTHPLFDLRKGGFLVNRKFIIRELHSEPCEQTRPYSVKMMDLFDGKSRRFIWRKLTHALYS
jgi:hypothetical protein